MKTPFLIWLVTYVLPALVADSIVVLGQRPASKKHQLNALIIHVALVLSILGSQYALRTLNLDFPWNLHLYSILAFALGATLSFAFLRSLGLWYLASSLIQELTLLSIGFLLLQFFSFPLTALLVVPVFVFSHPLETKRWLLRFLLISLWGVISLALFALIYNVWIITSIHAVIGTLLIKHKILYPKLRYKTAT